MFSNEETSKLIELKTKTNHLLLPEGNVGFRPKIYVRSSL